MKPRTLTDADLDFNLSPFSVALTDKVKDFLGRRLCPAEDLRSAYWIWSNSSSDSSSLMRAMDFPLGFSGVWSGEGADPFDSAYTN